MNGLPDIRQAAFANSIGAVNYSFLQPNHLGIFNDIEDSLEITRPTPVEDSYLIRKNDILLKRLNPDMATLVIDDLPNTTFSSNLFVIRVYKDYCPAYLACILENQGLSWLNSNIVGSLSAVKSISIKALATLKIPDIGQKKQKTIGQLWLLHKKRKKLLNDFIIEDGRLMSALIRRVATSAEEEE